MMKLSIKYFESIQLLRFVAATFVICAHMGIGIHSYKGIDLLFVISGFVIYWTSSAKIGTGWSSGIRFLKRRIIRIFSFYWLIFFLLIGLGFYPVSLDWALVKNVFLLPGHKSFLEVTWSLSVELYFYALFFLIIVYLTTQQAKLICSLFWGLTFLLLGLEWTNYPIKGTVWNFFLGQNIWLISSGLVACMCYKRIETLDRATQLQWSIGCLLVGGALFLSVVDYYSNLSFATVGIGSSLFLLGITTLENNQLIRLPTLLSELGNASYVAYLIHIPIIHYFSSNPELKQTNQGLIILGIWFLSLGIHQWIERPLIAKLTANMVGK